jgi:hypothetical protein
MKKLLSTFFLILVLVTGMQAQNWWQVNSLKLDNLPDKVLFHAEGQYSLDRAKGTISGFLHEAEAGIQLRKKRVLFNISTDLKYQKLEMGPQLIREKYYLIEGALIYDLLPNLHAEVGAVWEKDDQQYIDQRLIMYTGLNVELYSNQTWGLNVMGALGEQREMFVISPNVFVDWVAYAQQNFRLLIHPKIIFTEKFIYVRELGDQSGYRNLLRLQTVFRFTPHVSALVKHETKYEQQTLYPGIEKLNHFQTIGIRFEI